MFGFHLPLIILIATVFFIGFYTAKVFDHKKKTQKDEDAKQ